MTPWVRASGREGRCLPSERCKSAPSPPALVADVGCGAGGTLQYLEESGYFNLVGIDLSETLLAEAATRLATARLLRGSAEKIPCSSRSVDLLLCECVLSVLQDQETALDEFARVVKAGGFLVISDLFNKHGGGMAGLLSRETLMGLLTARGFTPLLWEEHKQLLKEFVVRMIFAGHPWRCRQNQAARGGKDSPDSYFLLIARKGNEMDGMA
ncbi:DVU_1556 family methyltransferase [Geotalea toluenoxydans]|uniref:DVU_1556 family methyltransferase n=1 Tax=Geotalea toluenoxydans TaxID=421624 RepID=UPI000AB57725|nr:class I SAM-dependent methyltransferase [Geotalea toluenoxydans]